MKRGPTVNPALRTITLDAVGTRLPPLRNTPKYACTVHRPTCPYQGSGPDCLAVIPKVN